MTEQSSVLEDSSDLSFSRYPDVELSGSDDKNLTEKKPVDPLASVADESEVKTNADDDEATFSMLPDPPVPVSDVDIPEENPVTVDSIVDSNRKSEPSVFLASDSDRKEENSVTEDSIVDSNRKTEPSSDIEPVIPPQSDPEPAAEAAVEAAGQASSDSIVDKSSSQSEDIEKSVVIPVEPESEDKSEQKPNPEPVLEDSSDPLDEIKSRLDDVNMKIEQSSNRQQADIEALNSTIADLRREMMNNDMSKTISCYGDAIADLQKTQKEQTQALEEMNKRLIAALEMKDKELKETRELLSRLEQMLQSKESVSQPSAAAEVPAVAAAAQVSASVQPRESTSSDANLLTSSSSVTPLYTLQDFTDGRFPRNGNPLLLDDDGFKTLMGMTKAEFRALGRVKQWHAKTRFWATQN